VKKLVLAGAALGMVALAWALTPLPALASPERLLEQAQAVRGSVAAPVLVPVLFVALSLVFVPLFVLRATIVLVFGPLLGPVYAILSVAVAALVGHALGSRLGAPALERLGGARIGKIKARMQRCGVLSIAALRLVPLGPHMLVAAVAGAARMPRSAFVAGTVLGMMPGLIVLAGLGAKLEALLGG
jgi:phospholipase D1/2